MVDPVSIWQSIVTNLPAIITSVATLLGVLYAAHKGNAKLDTIHGLVNSALGTSLSNTALLARRVASLTKDPADIGIAAAATKAADEHIQRQVKLDAQKV